MKPSSEDPLRSRIDWDACLADADADAPTGLRIGHLSGDDDFSTYLARIAPGARVPAHYHARGGEHYHVLQGRGELRLDDLDSGERLAVEVAARQSFTIGRRVVHALCNTGDTDLLLMFSCPRSHLMEDRQFVDRA